MKNKFILSLFFLFMGIFSYADVYNIEFTLKTYSNGNYDIIYYHNYKQIVKQVFKNNILTESTGVFPDGTLNFVNFNNVPVATVNIKNNKFDGECVFYKEKYTVRTLYASNPDAYKIATTYKDGILNGITKVFDSEGRILFELNYNNGILNGVSNYYDYVLMKQNIIEFDNGTKIKETYKELVKK